jgi:hypothetical protein
MAHYAFLDQNNIVTEVIVGKDETELIDGLTPEEWYGNFRGQRCVRTSYNSNIRGIYAGIGMYYDEVKDLFVSDVSYSDDWYFTMGADEFFARNMSEFVAKPNLRFLEIGSHKGLSATEQVKNVLTGDNSTITCVDIWESPSVEEYFDKEILPYANKINKVKSDSKVWLEQNQHQKFDFIYVDGDHSAEGIEADTRLSWNMLIVGGVMALDDVLFNEETEQANNAFVETIKDKATIIENGYQIWLRKIEE